MPTTVNDGSTTNLFDIARFTKPGGVPPLPEVGKTPTRGARQAGRFSSLRCVVFVFGLSLSPAFAQGQTAVVTNPEPALQNLRFREIGPAIMGGRVDDMAVVESDPSIVYIATASGGIWKTTNRGTTWKPIFDHEATSSIGDITLAPSDPSVVWVGAGEPNNRQSSSWGNGVYRSTNGGETWTHRGLADTHHIGRIVVHPLNPDVAYVAALGHLWGPNKERGVYKTTDGGKTWTQVLHINEDTGVVDIAMDPESPHTLYAAAYQRRRTPYGFNGGGPHSGVYKSTDSGATWAKLTQGLPGSGDVGRIGLQVYRSDPRIVYASLEHPEGGVFRSEDYGETWTRMSDMNYRPSYYSKIFIDPNSDRNIWSLGDLLYYSLDGGRTWGNDRSYRIHPDFHALWINPANSLHMIAGSDGGMNWSYDGGLTWDYVNTLPLGQFYQISVDMRQPYYVCGGLQDNGNWCGPSATTHHQGIPNDEWYRLGGNDGMYMPIDPTDFNTVYVGYEDGKVERRDLRTEVSKNIQPRPASGDPPYRFQWDSPLMLSPHDPKTVYAGAQFLLKSTDRGDTWTRISPDLTTGVDRDSLPIMGTAQGPQVLSLNDGVRSYPCITTLAESPLRAGVFYVGTDDGNLQVSRDGGKTWANVVKRIPGLPEGTYVSRVVASQHAEGTAYATFDGHRGGDFNIYVYTTKDYGQTWQAISNGFPRDNGTVNVITEHPRNPDLLFAGTEFGAYVSFNRGKKWQRLKMNLPTAPVDDIVIHPRDNDLLLGTHGRSIWILDNITALDQLNSDVLTSDLHLFDMRPAVEWAMTFTKRWVGDKMFSGANPPYGAMIDYYLRQASSGSVKITVLDEQGKTVREIEGPGNTGINRAIWDLRLAPPGPPPAGYRKPFALPPMGALVPPGDYTVRVESGGRSMSKSVRVEEDPRSARK